MPRRPSPWRRGGKEGPWYAQIGGKQVRLAAADASKTEANEALDEAWSEHQKARREGVKQARAGLTVHDAFNLFLAHIEQEIARNEMAPETVVSYAAILVPAAEAMGKLPVSSLTPARVEEWLAGTTWGPTTRNGVITVLKAAFNWCRKAGHLPDNPIREMPKPRALVTEVDLDPASARKILNAIRDRPFRDLLNVLHQTGARPSEIMRLEARHLDLGRSEAVMDGKTTWKTGRKRVIILTDEAAAILRRLAEIHPTGPLLRNRLGHPWTRSSVAKRFARLREVLSMGKEATAKSFRHAYVTDALSREIPIATVAELMGHTSTKMISRTYSKLRERRDYLREAAKKIRPGESGGGE